MSNCRRLCVVLGDQLDRDTPLMEGLDTDSDVFWFAECSAEAGHVWSHKARIAVFFAAMREFAAELEKNYRVNYQRIGEHSHNGLADALAASLCELKPDSVRVVQPGSYRVLQLLRQCCDKAKVPLTVLDDPHFFATPTDFEEWAEGRKELRQEYFYRVMRKRFNVLMADNGKPEGGKWNFDAANRGSFDSDGPGMLASPPELDYSDILSAAISDVEEYFGDHPGSLENFVWPITPGQAQQVLDDFIDNRLVAFGEYQDAMWTDEPFLYHSLLSAAMNLKLIRPHQVVEAAEQAYRNEQVSIEAAEGFIRQILGWREYVHGLYWLKMPGYDEGNALEATTELPDFFWSGDTELNCQQQAIRQTLDHGYAHHIQRLMITGLFCLLLGVDPKRVHQWYLAVYVDAVEWVEVPNVLGMSQYADGGIMASKPYIASGKYVSRMSNYCDGCKFDPAERTGDKACPITTLYWDFLQRHEQRFSNHPRLALQINNLSRLDDQQRDAIREQADKWREQWSG